jgi:hypothetical protein
VKAREHWHAFFSNTKDERVIKNNAQIVALRKLIKRPNKGGDTYEQRVELLQLCNDVCNRHNLISPIRVSPELSDKGFDWLSVMFKRLRSQNGLTADEARFVDCYPLMSDGPLEFRFRGLWDISTALDERYEIIETLPLWQVVTKNGEYFTYGYASWQSKGLVCFRD